MLTVGDHFPAFDLAAVEGMDRPALSRVRSEHYQGRWLVAFFWPKDFTFVCPTEIAAFAQLEPAFTEAGAAVLGVSVDNEYVHLAWRDQNPSLASLPFPLASDLKRELFCGLGILDPNEGVALRATFIVNPEGVIQFVSVHDLERGRNIDEVLRTLHALQAGGLTSCSWQPGEATLVAS